MKKFFIFTAITAIILGITSLIYKIVEKKRKIKD